MIDTRKNNISSNPTSICRFFITAAAVIFFKINYSIKKIIIFVIEACSSCDLTNEKYKSHKALYYLLQFEVEPRFKNVLFVIMSIWLLKNNLESEVLPNATNDLNRNIN